MKNKTQGRDGVWHNTSSNRWTEEEEKERQKIERKKRDEVGVARASSGGESEYNASDAASRRLTTAKKNSRTIYWLKSREFMRRFALAGASTRDEKPKFLSNPPLSVLVFYFSSLFELQETEEASEMSC